VKQQLMAFNVDAEIDVSTKTMNKKVREAQVNHFNYALIVGEKEEEAISVNVRDIENGQVLGEKLLADFVAECLDKMDRNSVKKAKEVASYKGKKPASSSSGASGSSASSAPAAASSNNKKAAAAPSNNAAAASGKAAPADMKSKLAEFPYLGGYGASDADFSAYDAAASNPKVCEEYQKDANTARWFKQMGALAAKRA
jgi:hypothetical protein